MVPSALTPRARFWLTAVPSAESSVRGRWCMDIRRLDGGQTDRQTTVMHKVARRKTGSSSGCDVTVLGWETCYFSL